MIPRNAGWIPLVWRRRVASGARWALLWLPLGIGLGIARPWVPRHPCWVQEEGPVQLAPVGALAVQLQHEVFETGLLFTYLQTRLEAWRTAALENRTLLATWEWSGGKRGDATVAWTGPGALHVSLSAWTGVTLPRPPLPGLILTVTQTPPGADDARAHVR